MTKETRTIRPAPDDAPGDQHHESTSSMLRRAAAEGAQQAIEHGSRRLAETNPLAAKLVRFIGGGLVFAISGASAGYFAGGEAPSDTEAETETRGPACDPMVEQHLQHIAKTGADLSSRLAADGLPQYAELVKQMTDVNQLPDDLRLCLLLRKRTDKQQ